MSTPPPRLLTLLVCSLVLASGCSDSTGPKAGPTSGHWTGSPSVYFPVDFTLTQTDSIITGTGRVFPPADSSQQMSVIGFVPTISDSTPVIMTFSVENVVPAVFIGALRPDGNTMAGTLLVAFVGTQDTVTFTRK